MKVESWQLLGKILKKSERHRRLKEEIDRNPFITDEELAEILEVSIPTIRLDRLELSIPEVRKRTKAMASYFFWSFPVIGG